MEPSHCFCEGCPSNRPKGIEATSSVATGIAQLGPYFWKAAANLSAAGLVGVALAIVAVLYSQI
jgi:hypothetical protein